MPSWKKVIISGSDAALNSLNVTQGITGSLLGTSSYASQAATSSFVTASNVYGPYGSNSITSASFAVSSSRAVSSSYALTASYALNGGTPLYIHTQSLASNTWTVPHNLSTSFPVVTVYDNYNNAIIPQEITSTNTSTLSITFPIPTTGYASVAGGTFSSISQEIAQEQSIINSIIFG